MRWYPTHALAYELATRQRLIGEIIEVHYCAGNRGPLYHGADKIVLEPTPERKAASWFYKKSEGGGAMLDYMGECGLTWANPRYYLGRCNADVAFAVNIEGGEYPGGGGA